jgi:N-acylneuraminate cytidylyltransferase
MRVAIIPARGGSTRIQRKNIKLFHGRPIISFSIETAKRSGIFDRIYVSTDSDEIGEVAQTYGAKRLGREYEEAQDHIGTQQIMREALRRLNSEYITHACCIYATAPMMTVQDLKHTWDLLQRNPAAEYAFAVAVEPFGPAGMFYFGRAQAFIKDLPLVAETSIMIPIPPSRAIDINTEEDWVKAEAMYAIWKKETA